MKKLAVLVVMTVACSDGVGPSPAPPVEGIRAVEVTNDLVSPVQLTAPEGDSRLFVVDQVGRIVIIDGAVLLATPFLDISDRVSYGGERGLFSMAFDPQYSTTRRFWVNYTDANGDTRIERYTVSGSDPNVADPGSATLVLDVAQPAANHNGGQIAFGPDGMLYIGMGDGGGGGDPANHGQTLSTLHGSLLRIDVRTPPYVVPPDNPYVGVTSARPEAWAHGLRNPWRFSFDAESNHLYIADVGQGQWEEINVVSADEPAVNYGWRIMEGAHCYNAASCNTAGLTLPVHEYSHAGGNCSVTGGFVYRGERLTGLQGHYFYSDFCTGFLRSFRFTGSAAADHAEWDVGSLGNVLAFGQDAAGELYMLTRSGGAGRVFRLEAADD